MKANHKLLSLSIFVLATTHLFAAVQVIDAAKHPTLQAALDAVPALSLIHI